MKRRRRVEERDRERERVKRIKEDIVMKISEDSEEKSRRRQNTDPTTALGLLHDEGQLLNPPASTRIDQSEQTKSNAPI